MGKPESTVTPSNSTNVRVEMLRARGVQKALQTVANWSPALTGAWAERLFRTPMRFKQPEAERAAQEKEALGREAAKKHGADVAETRLREAESLEKNASSTEQDAEAEQRRLQHEAAAADHQAAQLRAEAEK